MSKRSPDRPRRVTMSDVARRAGVSQPTVSFVLNDRRDVVVAEETRRRVLAAAAEMDFVPNRAAQHLRSNRSYLFGVVTNGIVSQPYAGRIILGIQQVVQPADHLCLAIDTTDDPEQGDVAVANLLATGVAAIVYASPAPRELHRSHRLDHTRTLFVNCWPDEGQVETVVLADEYHGGLAAAQAAFELGHRDVAFLGGYQGEYACVERHRGFLDAAQAAGIDPAVLVQRYGNYSISSGYNLTVQVLAEHRPTAIVCGNDRMAIGSLLALHVARVGLPHRRQCHRVRRSAGRGRSGPTKPHHRRTAAPADGAPGRRTAACRADESHRAHDHAVHADSSGFARPAPCPPAPAAPVNSTSRAMRASAMTESLR